METRYSVSHGQMGRWRHRDKAKPSLGQQGLHPLFLAWGDSQELRAGLLCAG
jgi:hypothetical protein